VKSFKLIFLIIFIFSCNNISSPDKENLIYQIKTFEDVPKGVVRIMVNSVQVELDQELKQQNFEYESTGSGFFISDNGLIITNNHVIASAVLINVYIYGNDVPYPATIVGRSECDDIAIIKIETEQTNYFNLSLNDVQLGQEIIAAGYPRGDKEITFLNGIISKKQTDGSTVWASIETAFEHTAEILPGSSGGPILNDSAEVIGISYGGNQDRQEFGISIAGVKNLINNLIEENFFRSLEAHIEQIPGLGLYIYSTELNSPLRKEGLTGGEIITSINGLNIENEDNIDKYCSYLRSRNIDSMLSFEGVDLKTLTQFKIETFLNPPRKQRENIETSNLELNLNSLDILENLKDLLIDATNLDTSLSQLISSQENSKKIKTLIFEYSSNKNLNSNISDDNLKYLITLSNEIENLINLRVNIPNFFNYEKMLYPNQTYDEIETELNNSVTNAKNIYLLIPKNEEFKEYRLIMEQVIHTAEDLHRRYLISIRNNDTDVSKSLKMAMELNVLSSYKKLEISLENYKTNSLEILNKLLEK